MYDYEDLKTIMGQWLEYETGDYTLQEEMEWFKSLGHATEDIALQEAENERESVG